MAQLSSQASVQFNTYLYFKSLANSKKEDCQQTAVIMRITQGGVYVMVQKYGIEGLLVTEGTLKCMPEKETALINDK